MSTVYLNGEFLPAEEAMISPLDRGFIFGDGVYEVIPVYGRRLFRLGEHLRRLGESLSGVRIRTPHDEGEWEYILNQLVARHETPDQSIYLQITRGVAKRDHAFPRDCKPTVFAMSSPLSPVSEEVRRDGVAAITLADTRWEYCHLKTISLLPNILLRQQALDQGAAEAILIRNGEITEGAASNLFIVRDGVIMTPPKGPRLLPGITRDLVMELAAGHGIAHRETAITPAQLAQADEVWLTSSTREILPVTRLDGAAVGDGRPGPAWSRMIALYQEYKREYRSEGGRSRD
jgi:D-alanine transaminase